MAAITMMATHTITGPITYISRAGTIIVTESIDVRPRPLFDSYVMVDWSAAGTRARGENSIWICYGRRDNAALVTENVPTRHQARERLHAFFVAESAAGRAVLAGFDFAFGYPSGFAARLALSGAAWRAIWDLLTAEIQDAPDNKNNRFEVASRLNHRISGGHGPFWGCPASEIWPNLGSRHHRRAPSPATRSPRIAGAADRRHLDQGSATRVEARLCWRGWQSIVDGNPRPALAAPSS